MLQCASDVDTLAAFYFNNLTMGEAPTTPAAINLARHIADCPNLFPEVRETTCYTTVCYSIYYYFCGKWFAALLILECLALF